MSLDVYLYDKPKTVKCTCDCGHVHERQDSELLFEKNITHNLGAMADIAGIYNAMWRPEDMNATRAGDLIETLEKGIKNLVIDPERYKKLNPENGWGTYDNLLQFAKEYLKACMAYPGALIEISR